MNKRVGGGGRLSLRRKKGQCVKDTEEENKSSNSTIGYGIRNDGNQCFLIVLIQVLYRNCRELVKDTNDENTDERELRKLLKDCCEDMDNSTTHSISITPLWSFLTSHYSYRWLSSATQDVHEVYLDLFPHLVNMSTSFQGILCNHYRCLECEHESIQKETFFSLSAFQCYALTTSDRNVLQKKDKYACSYCRIKTEAQYYTSIEKIPPLLFIHSPPSSHVTPHWTWTTFPISLSFAPTHTVQSIICHQGSTLTHGHFISYHLSSSSNLWYKCNDEHLECLQGPPWTSSSSLDFPTMASSKPYPYLSLFKNKI